MSKSFFEHLDKIVTDYVEASNCESTDDFLMTKRIAQIVLSKKILKANNNYKKRYGINSSDKLVSDFLNELNPKYNYYYNLRKSDGTFIFAEYKSCYEDGYSYFNQVTKKREIFIPIKYTLEDSFCIIHELMHDLNLNEQRETSLRLLFTETLSFLSEMLFEDYLKEKNITDAKKDMNSTIYYVYYYSKIVEFYLNILTKYLEYRYIDESVFREAYYLNPTLNINELNALCNKLINNETFDLDHYQSYVFAIVFASYMYERIKYDKRKINELFELNEMLSLYNFENFFDYLNLSYSEDDLTDASYKKLEKSYKNYIKRNI